jgi:hypothetical protein
MKPFGLRRYSFVAEYCECGVSSFIERSGIPLAVSPAIGKNESLCVLCVSVVNLPFMSILKVQILSWQHQRLFYKQANP